jgi:hypothetical protein
LFVDCAKHGLVARLDALAERGCIAVKQEAAKLAVELLSGPLCVATAVLASSLFGRVLSFLDTDSPKLVRVALTALVDGAKVAEHSGCTAALRQQLVDADAALALDEMEPCGNPKADKLLEQARALMTRI